MIVVSDSGPIISFARAGHLELLKQVFQGITIPTAGDRGMPIVKGGSSRQVVIPKKFHDKLGLAPGDYLEVELEKGKVVFTPKMLVDKQFEEHLEEGLKDVREGRVYGPFSSSNEITESLHNSIRRKAKKS